MPFIDQFDVILFDLNGTFMFGHDRFGPEQDYFATYRAQDGVRLQRAQVTTMMERCLHDLLVMYDSAAHIDNFPSLAEAFREFSGAAEEDIEALCATFAAHELGAVPTAHADMLRQLSTRHQLGVVSNICGAPTAWREHFDAVGLASVFSCLVFSSEGRSIKPSPRLFQRALGAFPDAKRVLFVGDSFERDIVPARALGCATAWISDQRSSDADCVIPSLLALPSVAG